MLKPSGHNGKIIHLPPGELLHQGRYRIERELNRGGTAVVYAAEDLLTRSYVALKVMNGPDQVPIKVVRREITFSSSMKHDNIVRLLDVFAEKQQMVIVWELISGPDLLDLLNENSGCLSEPMAAFYFVQLLEAVTFMHTQGFCHRDIKPENCMVQRANKQLKLIDFGLSKHLASAHTLGVGTPDYMCPEMLPRQSSPWGASPASSPSPASCPSYDARAVDAWAMGVLMFLLTTGKYPFEDPRHPNNLAHTIGNVLAGRVRPFPPTMSEGCRALITGLLHVDPKARTTLAELKANPWLQNQALQYACTIGMQQAIDFSRYSEQAVQAVREAAQAGQAGQLEDASGGSMELQYDPCSPRGQVDSPRRPPGQQQQQQQHAWQQPQPPPAQQQQQQQQQNGLNGRAWGPGRGGGEDPPASEPLLQSATSAALHATPQQQQQGVQYYAHHAPMAPSKAVQAPGGTATPVPQQYGGQQQGRYVPPVRVNGMAGAGGGQFAAPSPHGGDNGLAAFERSGGSGFYNAEPGLPPPLCRTQSGLGSVHPGPLNGAASPPGLGPGAEQGTRSTLQRVCSYLKRKLG